MYADVTADSFLPRICSRGNVFAIVIVTDFRQFSGFVPGSDSSSVYIRKCLTLPRLFCSRIVFLCFHSFLFISFFQVHPYMHLIFTENCLPLAVRLCMQTNRKRGNYIHMYMHVRACNLYIRTQISIKKGSTRVQGGSSSPRSHETLNHRRYVFDCIARLAYGKDCDTILKP